MSGITTHVLDTARGRPAAGIAVTLSRWEESGWREIARAATNEDGRVSEFPGGGPAKPGTYRLRFETGAYHREAGIEPFWPHVDVAFDVTHADQHHHVPLLLSPFGYSTYRGS